MAGLLSFITGPSEDDIQKAMAEIETARKAGQPIDASQMDAAHQTALKRLLSSNGNPFAGGAPDPFADAEAEQKRRQGNAPSPGTLGAFGLGPKKK